MRKTSLILSGLLALAAVAGCGGKQAAVDEYAGSCPADVDCSLPGVTANFTMDPTRADFFDIPWPADTRLTDEGTIDLAGFPNPGDSSLLDEWLATAQASTRGFGTNSAVYFTFDGTLDPQSLPAGPAETMEESSPVFLIDLSNGPEHGRRIPLVITYYENERQFTPASTLVLRPVCGFPLRSSARYAAVVTRGVTDDRGRPLGASGAFECTKYHEAPQDEKIRPWWNLLNGSYGQLEELGIAERADIVAMTVYTTQPVVEEMDRIRDFVAARAVPSVSDWQYLGERTDLHLFEGYFEMPEYQAGTPPDFEGGGWFVFDTDGVPIPQRTPLVAFTLAIPKGTTPADGWPIVMYHHGTGGSRFSFCSGSEDVCDLLAEKGVASIGIDQPLHGERNTGNWDETTKTFNVTNIEAFRDNFRQGAADLLVLRCLVEELEVPASIAPDSEAIPIDELRVAFMGHSQGGITGPIYLGTAKDVNGAVLSAAGGGLNIVLLERKDPLDIRALLVTVMMIEDEEFDLEHPVVNVFQAFAERADQLNYARRFIAEPPGGSAPTHLFYSEGLHDAMTMPRQIENLAAASGCALMMPVTREFLSMQLRGIEPIDPPVSGNTQGPGGEPVTAVLAQYPDDGHFAVFDNDDAKRHYTGFIETLMADGLPSVGP